MARRVLLIELQAQAQGATTFATWNAADKTANTTLSGGNLIATAATTTNYNSVRGNVGMTSGAWYWETTHAFASGSGFVLAAGIANADFVLSASMIGADTAGNSVGGPRQDGVCSYKNASTGDAGTVTNGVIVRHWLDLDAGTYKAAIAGGAWITAASGLNLLSSELGRAWYAIAQFTTATHSITANFGATAFTYAVPDGARPGIYSRGAPTASTVYLASEFVLTDSGSTPANTLFEGRLLSSSVPSLNRSASCWVWGDEAKISFGELEFANADGGLEYLRALIVRDRPALMRYGTPTEALNPAACAIWASALADRLEFTPNGTVRLVLTDRLAQLDKPLTRATFPSWIQETALTDRPKPVCLGTAYSVDPVLVDPSLLYFDVHDDAIFAVDEVADMGDPDLLNTDYYWRNNGFDKHAVPAGKMTAKVRAGVKRGAVVINEPFTAWVAGAFDTNPSGWTVSGELDATRRVYQSTAGRCGIKNSTAVKLYMERNLGLVAGTPYIVVVNVTRWTSGYLEFRLWNGAAETGVLFYVDGSKREGVHAFVVTPTAGYQTLRLVAPVSLNCDVELESLDVYAATHISRLPDWLTELCVTRGGLTAGDIDTAGTIAALDTKAPYSLGYYTRDAVMIREVVRDTLRSFTGWLVPDRDGKLIVGRLEAPSNTPTLSIVESDIAADPVFAADAARNLTTLAGALRNWSPHVDSDFAGAVTAQQRAILRKRHRETRRAAGIVNAFYSHAETAPVLDTLLQVGTDAQAEISRVASLYSVQRGFYTIPVFMDLAASLTLKPGDTVSVTAPWFDLGSGKLLLVVGVEVSFFSSVVRLVLWG